MISLACLTYKTVSNSIILWKLAFWQKWMPHPKEKKQQQRALLNSTKESKTHLGQFLVVLLLDYTFTFSFTLSKLVFVSLLLSVKIIYVALDLVLQYIIPEVKIFILKKLTETFKAKHSEKYLFWIMPLKFLKNILEGIISVKLLATSRLLEVGLHLRYFSKTLIAN